MICSVHLPFTPWTKDKNGNYLTHFTKQVLILKVPFHQGTVIIFYVPSPQHCKHSAVPPTSQLTAECVSHKAPELLSVTTRRECQTWISLCLCVLSLTADGWWHNVQTIFRLHDGLTFLLADMATVSIMYIFLPWWWTQLILENKSKMAQRF